MSRLTRFSEARPEIHRVVDVVGAEHVVTLRRDGLLSVRRKYARRPLIEVSVSQAVEILIAGQMHMRFVDSPTKAPPRGACSPGDGAYPAEDNGTLQLDAPPPAFLGDEVGAGVAGEIEGVAGRT